MEGFLFVFGSLAAIVAAAATLLRKAGFSRWYALLFPLSIVVPLIVFALVEWPVRRELGWLRVATGIGSEDDVALAQSYAICLERDGQWSKAIEVYETLATRARDPEDAEYLRQSAARLRERADSG